ncbi:MAG: ribose 5-phosphate isomerase B [Bacillota bacterium]
MRIAIGSDHGGYVLKKPVIEAIREMNLEYVDYGTYSEESCDYPDIARKVAKAVVKGEADKGILLCGTGIGICIAANKIKGIRCGNITDAFSAKMAAEHNDANIISMGGRLIDEKLAKEITMAYLSSKFAGGRHKRRIDKINEIENNN